MIKPNPCPLCGANMNMVGARHRCFPAQSARAPVSQPVDNDKAKTTVINVASAGTAQTNAQRQAKWRAANLDKHRARNRDHMRHKRAIEKNATTAA
jgi:hypothetical protein